MQELNSPTWETQTLPGISRHNLPSSPAGKTEAYVEVPDRWRDYQTEQELFIPSVSI